MTNVNTAALREQLAKLPKGPYVVDYEFNDYGGRYDTIRTERFDSILGEYGSDSETMALLAAALNALPTLLDNTDHLAALEAGMRGLVDGYSAVNGLVDSADVVIELSALLNRPADGGE